MKRLFYGGIFAALLLTEILIGKFADPASFLRCSGGDIIIIPLLYFFVRIFTDKLEKSIPALIFVFGCAVELLQAADLCGILGIDKRSIVGIIIGTTGSWGDIACYFVGTILIYVYQIAEQNILNLRGTIKCLK